MPNGTILTTRRDAAEAPDTHGLEKLLNTLEAADALNISKRSFQDVVAERKIGFIKFGRTIRFTRADIERFIDAHRCQPVGWKSETGRARA